MDFTAKNEHNLVQDNLCMVNLNDYILQQKIGEGSFSKVYIVKEKKTGKIFAAKILRQELFGINKDSILDFRREVSIISKIIHPSVLRFYGYSPVDFKNKSKPVIITEYAKNKSLKCYLQMITQSNFILNDTQKLIIIYGISVAMSYLHSHGIVHRDLKPDNILLDEFLFPKICDFGLSKSYDDKILSNAVCKGTPIYMAPEIWENNEYSNLSDIYAFAIIVYQIISDEIDPFDKNEINSFNIMAEVVKGLRPKFKKPIPKSYQKLIEKCWSNDPNNRPSSFEEILDILRNDKGFITEKVDEKMFFDYINFIENSVISFDPSKKNIFLDVNPKPISFINNLLNKIHIAPFEYVSKLDNRCIKLVIEAENDSKKQYLLAKYIIKGINYFHFNVQLGIKYLKKSIENGNSESAIYYCKLLIKGKIIPQNLKKAIKIIESKLKENQEMCTLLYGKIYLKEKNFLKAKKCFEELIELENNKAMYEYGKMYQKGLGMQVDTEKTVHYYKKLIQKGFLKAMYKYGNMLIETDDEEKKEEGFNYIKEAAKKGHTKSMYKFSILMRDKTGNLFESDDNEATIFLRKSALKGNFDAIDEYASRFMLLYQKTKFDIEESIRLLKMSCDKGNIDSILLYGIFLNKGEFVPKNQKEAAKYIKIAAHNGNVESLAYYGKILQNGQGVPIDKGKAIEYYKKGIEKGNITAINLYGISLLNGDGVPVDKKEAMKYFKMGIEKGNEASFNNYAMMLQQGEFNEADTKESLKYFKMAADKGIPFAINNYAYALANGIGIEANKEEAAKYYKIAIDKGCTLAMSNYAVLLMSGDLNKTDVYQAKRYLQMAIDKGNINAIINYALFLYHGIGMEANIKESMKYYKMAADLGHLDSLLSYSFWLVKDGDLNDQKKGVEYLKELIEKGKIEAITIYANCLEAGIGIETNIEEAIKYYKMAIEKGEPDSMYYYAKILENGNGVPVNIEEAIKYYKMAIDHGDVNSMKHYAHMLEFGEGIPVDKNEADKYYKMANEHDKHFSKNDVIKSFKTQYYLDS